MDVRKVKRQHRTQKKFRLHALRIHPFCFWCQCPLVWGTATADHLIPLSRGGTNDWDNLRLACVRCNQARRNDLPQTDPSACPVLNIKPTRTSTPPCVPLVVAWTRYPGGRWRRTFRSNSREVVLRKVAILFGRALETVVLPEGVEPELSL